MVLMRDFLLFTQVENTPLMYMCKKITLRKIYSQCEVGGKYLKSVTYGNLVVELKVTLTGFVENNSENQNPLI